MTVILMHNFARPLLPPIVAGDLVLLDMHFLQQSSAQAIFSWHHDCEQYSHMVLSIVLSLTDTASSMQVAGYDEIMYQGSGSASCFLSNATHRSGFAERGTKKIAFFFGLESRMDTYETYPKVIRAPLPTLPIFYDKKSDCQKVGCFCLHNHVIIEKDDFLTGEGCYMVADEISQGELRAKVSRSFSPIGCACCWLLSNSPIAPQPNCRRKLAPGEDQGPTCEREGTFRIQ